MGTSVSVRGAATGVFLHDGGSELKAIVEQVMEKLSGLFGAEGGDVAIRDLHTRASRSVRKPVTATVPETMAQETFDLLHRHGLLHADATLEKPLEGMLEGEKHAIISGVKVLPRGITKDSKVIELQSPYVLRSMQPEQQISLAAGSN